MGGAKRLMEEEDAKRAVALSIMLKTKDLKECPVHPGSYIDQENGLEESFKYAAYHFKKGEYTIFADQRDATDTIQDAFDEFGASECYSCEKYREDD